jgi:hypothetical protein
MAFNITSLLDTMINAVKPALLGFGKAWNTIASKATKALKLLAEQIVFVGKSLKRHAANPAEGMDLDEGKDVIEGAMLVVVANVAGAAVILKAQAQKVIDAAIGAVKGAVNAAIGVALL